MAQRPEARPLGDREREIVKWVVNAAPIPDADHLITQFDSATVNPDSGPTFLDLAVPRTAPRSVAADGPLPGRYLLHSETGELEGEVVLWMSEGHLSGLELAWYTDDPPTEWPSVGCLTTSGLVDSRAHASLASTGAVQDTLSLEQIEDDHWGDPPEDATTLIRTVHRLRCKPISEMDAEDLRVMLGQQEGTEVLLPRALARLEHDPLAEGDLYPGDLLVMVLRLPQSYWRTQPEQLAAVERIITALGRLGDLDALGAPADFLTRHINQFHQRLRTT
jgi:hypothetical protein